MAPYVVYLLCGGKKMDKCYIGITSKDVRIRLNEHNGRSSVYGARPRKSGVPGGCTRW
jgi:predicted GIY-YIG superfamily endonuclease